MKTKLNEMQKQSLFQSVWNHYLGSKDKIEEAKEVLGEIKELQYIEDMIERFNFNFIGCLNPNIESQEYVTLIDDREDEIKVVQVDTKEMLQEFGLECLNETVKTGEYSFKNKLYYNGKWYDNDDEIRDYVLKLK